MKHSLFVVVAFLVCAVLCWLGLIGARLMAMNGVGSEMVWVVRSAAVLVPIFAFFEATKRPSTRSK